MVALAALHGMAVMAVPAAPLIAVGVWWNANTIAHNFVHRPFFRAPSLNLLFSLYQSVLLGFPQTLWRDRHLAHHAGETWTLHWSSQLLVETALVGTFWAILAASNPLFFITAYLPGYTVGLALCMMQGHYEHAGAATSHYGLFYNVLCFNDGYHAEHHADPSVHWTELPRLAAHGAPDSRWPALLRWLDAFDLEALERLVLHVPWMQRFVLDVHRNAFQALLPELQPLRRIAIVGGGLFPRTAIVLRQLVPGAELVVIDANRRNIETARSFVDAGVEFVHARFVPTENLSGGFDLIVIPLSFQGDRQAIYRRPPARAVVVHDWLWRRRGRGRIVSTALLKRLNVVRQ